MLATFCYIKKKDFKDAFAIAVILRDDEEDLIHKAVGWMVREIGNRDLAAEERFLDEHYKKMPRTMLRYAIEKFPEKKRQAYLKGHRLTAFFESGENDRKCFVREDFLERGGDREVATFALEFSTTSSRSARNKVPRTPQLAPPGHSRRSRYLL